MGEVSNLAHLFINIILIFPEVVFEIEKILFNSFSFKHCILSNSIFAYKSIVINIGFSNYITFKSSLLKDVIKRDPLSII